MLGTVQRKSLYPILERWFDIPYPSQEDQNIPLDSGLSDARRLPDYPVIKYKESLRRPVDQDVLSISAEVSEQMERRALHQIAYEIGADLLETAREKRRGMKPEERRQHLRMGLERMLGSIDPDQHVEVLRGWRRSVTGAEVEALALESEDGTLIPLLLLKPGPDQKADFPVVVALAEGGKSRFLKNRAPQLSRLLRKGFAVCALDVRGTGETASSQYTQGDEPAVSLAELGESLLGGRLKDVRTVLNFLRGRPDFDGERISLWGDSFTPVNEKPIWVDELLSRPVSPQIQHIASPLGAHLALLTALFDPGINAVAVRGGLISYLSLLESNYTYVPPGIVVSRFLEVGDIADIAAALSPLPLLVSAPVTGRNFLASESDVEDQLHLLEDDYGVSAELVLAPGSGDADEEADRLVDWLASR
jgi:hypothetical protein